MPRFIRLPDGTMQPIPELAQPAPEQFELEQPEPVQSSKWDWIGSPSRPEAKEHSDGLSDLFDAPDQEEIDEDMDDLTGVDFEKDILDANEEGNLEDLTNVSNEDIIGVAPRPQQRKVAPKRITSRHGYAPPTSMGRSGR